MIRYLIEAQNGPLLGDVGDELLSFERLGDARRAAQRLASQRAKRRAKLLPGSLEHGLFSRGLAQPVRVTTWDPDVPNFQSKTMARYK
jgi:hypothetical protein